MVTYKIVQIVEHDAGGVKFDILFDHASIRPPPDPPAVTFLNGTDADISIWWTQALSAQRANVSAYFHAARAYLEAWGKPVAFYSDKHGVFRVNHPGALGGDGMTQFGRALHALNIDIICANSSPAKSLPLA
jgi:hypothetical protein